MKHCITSTPCPGRRISIVSTNPFIVAADPFGAGFFPKIWKVVPSIEWSGSGDTNFEIRTHDFFFIKKQTTGVRIDCVLGDLKGPFALVGYIFWIRFVTNWAIDAFVNSIQEAEHVVERPIFHLHKIFLGSDQM